MGTLSLTVLAQEQLKIAMQASSGRSAHTVYGERDTRLRQTLIALLSGRVLDENESPGEATIHVLQGRIRFSTGQHASSDAGPGDLIAIPSAGLQSVEALENSAILLTVSV